jgi:hypothetical protein
MRSSVLLRVSLFVVIHSFGSVCVNGQAGSIRSNEHAEIAISTPKAEYMLGEPVRIDLKFTKKGDFTTKFEDNNSISGGGLKVFIARDEGKFLRYKFDGWVADRKYLLEGKYTGYYWRGSDRHSFDTVFFNSRPVTGHLSDYGRRLAEEGMILTDHAFPAAGEYRVKATLFYSRIIKGKAFAETIESAEIQIRLKRPVGDDLKVWEIIESDPRIGFFMTAGWVSVRPPATRESFLAEIDKIVADHANSHLAGILKEKADLWRARSETAER